jgi:hypothetical protein
MKHIMLDIETMGGTPNGAIASIGAIRFDPFGDELADPFYVVVDLDGQEKYGRKFDGSTITWWLQQSREAQAELYRGDRVKFVEALEQFQKYVGPASVPTWAYPSTFDHSIMQSAYQGVGMKYPVHYREQFCMRGLARMAEVEPPVAKVGTDHNALDDAQFQAKWLQAILKKRWVQ